MESLPPVVLPGDQEKLAPTLSPTLAAAFSVFSDAAFSQNVPP